MPVVRFVSAIRFAIAAIGTISWVWLEAHLRRGADYQAVWGKFTCYSHVVGTDHHSFPAL